LVGCPTYSSNISPQLSQKYILHLGQVADSKNVKSELIQQQVDNFNKYKHTCYGNFCEVFSFNDLEWYYEHDKRPETREHVSMGMIQDMTVDYEIDLK